MDFYAILGIPMAADQAEIRSAYRILARLYHPDKGVGSSTEKFRQVNEAYETLVDPARRQQYDLSLARARATRVERIKTVTPPPERLHQESPDVFGRFVRLPYDNAVRSFQSLNDVFEELIRSIDGDSLFGSRWR